MKRFILFLSLLFWAALSLAYDVDFFVKDESGSPLAGAVVTVYQNGTQVDQQTTNSDGALRFPLSTGDYTYTVTLDGYQDESGSFSVQDQDINIDVTLKKLYELDFRVLDESNNAISGATVTIYQNGSQIDQGQTDAQGILSFYLVNGSYDYTVSASGYKDESGNVTIQGEDTKLDITLAKVYQVTFNVKDEDNNPLEDVTVTVSQNGSQVAQGQTDAQGQVSFSLENGTYDYTASKSGYNDATGSVTVQDGDVSQDVTMQILKYTVTFTVYKEDGTTPLEGATISINNQTLTTDANGQATIDLPNGSYDYTVTADGYNDATGTVTVQDQAQSVSITMQLKTYPVTFNVTDYDTGDPIPNADISIIYDDTREPVPGGTATTDENGQAVIELPNDSYIYHITKDGYGGASGTFTVQDAAKTINATMFRVYHVTFVVKDANDNPIANAKVTITYPNGGGQVAGSPIYSDANGQATIDLPNGDYDYTVTADGYQDATGSITVNGSDVNESVTMQLVTYTVTFTVYKEDGQTGLQGASISINGQTLTTDANGQATVNLPNGDYDYTVSAAGYQDATGTVTVNGSDVNESITMQLVTYTVTFTVYKEDGQTGLQGASISINGQTLTTDQNGQATVNLPNGDYDYTITANGYQNTSGTITVNGADVTQQVTMQLVTYVVTFTVYKEDGQTALQGASISINGQTLTTDANGQATINLPNGDYDYTVTTAGYQDAMGTITVNGSDVTESVTMQPVTYVVTFTVYKEDGTTPLENASISINGQTLTTDANGQATINLPNGDYNYTVSAAGYQDATGTVTVNGADVTQDVTMQPVTYVVTFTVYKEDGTTPLENAYISINGQTLTTDANGQATVNLPNGDYNYTVTAAGYQDATGTITVNGSDVNESVTMQLVTYVVTFTVYKEDGQTGLQGASISINGQTLTTDANGQATTNLPNGDYNYTVSAAGYQDATGTVTVNGSDVTESVTMQPVTYVVTFTVYKEDGQTGLQGASISINGQTLTTDANGQATINLTNGNYDYTVTADGYQDASGTITVNGADVTQEVTMQPVTYVVTFTVYKEDGQTGLQGASISINGQTLTTDANGQATINLPNGDYDYTVTAAGYQDATGSITVNGADVTQQVTMQLVTYVVTFTVKDANGNAIQDVNIEITDQAGNAVQGSPFVTDQNGQAAVSGLVAGTYNYTVSKDGYQPVTGSFDPSIVTDPIEITLQESTTTGISTHEVGISIYPNPTADVVVISVEGARINSVELNTLSGRKVSEKANHGTGKVIMDLSGLPQGVYLMRIYTDSEVLTKTVIKQ